MNVFFSSSIEFNLNFNGINPLGETSGTGGCRGVLIHNASRATSGSQ